MGEKEGKVSASRFGEEHDGAGGEEEGVGEVQVGREGVEQRRGKGVGGDNAFAVVDACNGDGSARSRFSFAGTMGRVISNRKRLHWETDTGANGG
jgi:hypothetical protein